MSLDVVAIDGPAASGKSTVARHTAARLGWLYVDSGALYRAVTWLALKHGVDPHDGDRVVDLLDRTEIRFFVADGAVCFRLEGDVLNAELRTDAVNGSVSPVAAIPGVRKRVVAWLREMVGFGPLVMEGRDIGTAVFPDAMCKFYLDASPEERARRRHAEMGGFGNEAADAVAANLKQRDAIDSTRRTDPLKVADDARRIDSTGMTIDQVAATIVAVLKEQGSGGTEDG